MFYRYFIYLYYSREYVGEGDEDKIVQCCRVGHLGVASMWGRSSQGQEVYFGQCRVNVSKFQDEVSFQPNGSQLSHDKSNFPVFDFWTLGQKI